ncbi:MAG: cbb3-type cytochrome oxidase assembly protein CcoS [Solirubrobacteraceae bacterium]
MEILLLMIVCSVSLAFLFLGLFLYSLKDGQFDEGESPAVRILFENKKKEQ